MRTERFRIKRREFGRVVKAEYKHLFTDPGLILVLILALLIYSTAYSFAYKNQVLRNVPIGVVDMSRTPSSRALTETFDATANVFVAYNPTNMQEAEKLFFDRKIYGVVYIPEDYERNLLGGRKAIIGVYVDGSYFLVYRQVFYDVVGGLNELGADVEFRRLLVGGASVPQAEAVVSPVQFKAENLFNPYLGYGTFVMPAIMILIIQQTLLIGIGMAGGTWREFGLYRKLITPGERRLSTLPIVLGKTVVYLSVYCATVSYILGVHYQLFHYPMNGSLGAILVFMFSYVVCCIFLGIAVSTLFRYRENSILFFLWSSIPLLLLSGASIPRETMPDWLYYFGKVFPSGSGVDGFVRLQTMGAGLSDVMPQLLTLWILAGIFLIFACIGIRRVLNRDDVKSPPAPAGTVADHMDSI